MSKSRIQSYDQLIPQTEKPLANRRELAIGRGGEKVKPRKMHLNAEEIAELRAEYKETKVFPNPHNKGFYHYLVAALVSMGVNEPHPQGRVMQRVEKLMSAEDTIQGEGRDKTTAWDRFTKKDPRNAETGKDYEARFDQNVTVLQRVSPTDLNPYGRRLLDVGSEVLGTKGAVIDVLVNPNTGNKSLRLNTNSDTPINEAKTRGFGSPAAIEAAKAEARERKAKARNRAQRKAAKAAEAAPAEAEATTAVAE